MTELFPWELICRFANSHRGESFPIKTFHDIDESVNRLQSVERSELCVMVGWMVLEQAKDA